MKKLIISILLIGLSMPAFASRGGHSDRSRGSKNLDFKNSQAGFIYESTEYALLQLYRSQPELKNAIKGSYAEITDTDTSRVYIETTISEQSIDFTCLRFDDWSKSGTVLKKEVRCQPAQ